MKIKSNYSNFDDKVSFYQKGLEKVKSVGQLNNNKRITNKNNL